MASNRFRLTSPLSNSDRTDFALKNYYKSWRYNNQESKSPFLALDNSFRDKHLSELEAGPLRLYLYFSFAANNDYGHSWHSIQKISEFFNTQTRTIDNWLKVLVEKELIYREQKENKSHTTYLLPFSDTIIQHPAPKNRDEDNQDLLEDLIKIITDQAFIYGDILNVFHVFQWRSIKGKPINGDNSLQLLLIITKRKNGVLIGHIYDLKKSDHLSVSQLSIDEPLVFTSSFVFKGTNVIGLALPQNPPLLNKSSLKDMLVLINELAGLEEWEIKDRQKLEFGKKDEVLPIFDEESTGDVEETPIVIKGE